SGGLRGRPPAAGRVSGSNTPRLESRPGGTGDVGMREERGTRREQLLELIRDLTAIPGPSGNEHQVRARMPACVASFAVHVLTDALGHLSVTAPPRSTPDGTSRDADRVSATPQSVRIMLAAHMDAIGVIAIHIDDEGFVRIRPIGGVSP